MSDAAAQRVELQLSAPSSPGKYKVIYNRVPYFTERPILDATEKLFACL